MYVSTIAGSRASKHADGPKSEAYLNGPLGIVIDKKDNLFVAEYRSPCVRKVTLDGKVTTFAGHPNAYGTQDGSAKDARFRFVDGMMIDSLGDIVAVDVDNHAIRRIDATGRVTTVAGVIGGTLMAYRDGPAMEALLGSPRAICEDRNGNYYVTDARNRCIRKVTKQGIVSSIAASKDLRFFFSFPHGIVVDKEGVIYVSDALNFTIKKVDLEGNVTVVAGIPGISGFKDGDGEIAQFNEPRHMVMDSYGAIYVADTHNQAIRKIRKEGEKYLVTTVAGGLGFGNKDGWATEAQLADPYGITLDSKGNIYVTDSNTVRKIFLLKWNPKTHAMFSKDHRDKVKTIIGLKNLSSGFKSLPQDSLSLIIQYVVTE